MKPYIRPVEKVEISEKHVGRRAIAAAVFLLIGVGAFAYFIVGLVRGEPGWTEITALSSKVNCSGDFVFLYELGTEGGSAQSERRAVTAVYTAAAEKAYWMFENVRAEETSAPAGTVDAPHGSAVPEAADGRIAAAAVGSVRYLNDHPNETVAVDQPLYEAFAKLDAAGSRFLYLPALYETYDNLFASASDSLAAEFDPRLNQAVAAYFEEVLTYANDPAEVNLELLGDNQVRLYVSESYLDFAAENEIDSFIDFGWMKNAFVADYLAEELTGAGFTDGSISSLDGFVRNLDGRETDYSFHIYDRAADGEDGKSGQILPLAVFQYHGPLSLVWLRDYRMNDGDRNYYQMDNGETRTAYIDPRDGFCRNSISSLVSYSYDDSVGCADILLSMIPIYISDEFDADAVEALAGTVYSVYRQGIEIHANDPKAEFSAVREGFAIRR